MTARQRLVSEQLAENGRLAIEARGTFNRDTVRYALAVSVDRLTAFIILPLLTSSLDRRDFGAWSQIQSAYGLLSTVLLLGFFHTMSGLVAGRPAREASRIYAGVLLIVSCSTALLSAFLVLAPSAASALLFADDSYEYLLGAVAWFAGTECFYELAVLAFLRAKGRIGVASVLHAAKGVLRLMAVWLGLGAAQPLSTILVIVGGVNILMVGYVLARYIFRGGIEAPFGLGSAFWRVSFVAALSTAATILLGWVNLSLNRFLIVHFEGLDDVATYSANYSIVSIALLVPMVITFTLLHHVSATLAAGAVDRTRDLINRAVNYYVYATLPILTLVASLYHPLVSLLAPRGYDAGFVLPGTLIAYFFAFGLEQVLVFSTFPGGGAEALRGRMIALFINVLGGFTLIRAFGITAAALPPLLGSITIVLVCAAALRSRLGYDFPWSVLSGTGGAALVMFIVGYAISIGIDIDSWWMLGVASAVLTLVYVAVESLRSTSLTRQLVTYFTEFARLVGSEG